MELIPILSTIILVATISTFMLAIGAYLLYKIRESKGQQMVAPIPSTIKAELFTPAETPAQEQQIAPQPIYFEPQPVPVYQQRPVGPQYAPQPRQYAEAGQNEIKNYPKAKTESRFLKYTSEGYVTPSKEKKTPGTLKWK
jgi:hypothetical protein